MTSARYVAVAAVAVWVLCVEMAYAQTASPTSSGKLMLVDGSTAPYQSLAIRANEVSGAGVSEGTALDDLQRIEPASRAAVAAEPIAVIELRGGRVLAKKLTIADEKCRIEWSGGEPLSLAVDLLRAVRFDAAAEHADFEKAAATPAAELDRVFIKDGEAKLSSVAGLVHSLDAVHLMLEVGGQTRQVLREKIFGIVVAQPAAPRDMVRCAVTFRDGSALSGHDLTLSGDTGTLALSGGGQTKFAWSMVSGVSIRSSRVAFLSDLKPLVEEQQPILTLPMGAQRDKSVLGKPLKLGTRVFEKGWGVHSRSLLTFAAEKKWDTLAATIGIDAAASGRGECEFVVRADGHDLLRRPMKASDPPAEIQLPITGAEKVTLIVEPGAGLDLADHANWCDARFVREKSREPEGRRQ